MKKLLVLAVALFSSTAIFAQVELDLNNFDPATYELGDRCIFIDTRHDELKTLRNFPKTNISRVLEATAEEATAMLAAHGIIREYPCGEGMLWVEVVED